MGNQPIGVPIISTHTGHISKKHGTYIESLRVTGIWVNPHKYVHLIFIFVLKMLMWLEIQTVSVDAARSLKALFKSAMKSMEADDVAW